MNFPHNEQTLNSYVIIHSLEMIIELMQSQNYINLPNE
jgi:hypothetical protein